MAKRKVEEVVEQQQPKPPGQTVDVKSKQDKLEVEVTGPERIETVEQALAKAQVDQNVWAVERFLVNSWEVGAKGPNGRVCVTPLFQVKVWLKLKKGWSPEEFRQLVYQDIRLLAPKGLRTNRRKKDPVLAVLSIMDLHLGKLGWGEETGSSHYDLRIARERYRAAADDLLRRAAEFKPKRILIPHGNDFFHVDNTAGTTTRGTVQDVDGRSQKAFRIGVQLTIETIRKALEIAPVDVVIVSGNHDTFSCFCLGEAVKGYFHDTKSVTVDNTADIWSYYRWGKVLLGFVHGDGFSKTKQQQLPSTLASDRPSDWAECPHREILLGHYHSEQEDIYRYRAAETVRDVTVRVLPSLSGVDAWHREQNYKAPLGAECLLYHKERGKIGTLSFRLEDDYE